MCVEVCRDVSVEIEGQDSRVLVFWGSRPRILRLNLVADLLAAGLDFEREFP